MGDAAGGEVGLTLIRLRREGTLFPWLWLQFFSSF